MRNLSDSDCSLLDSNNELSTRAARYTARVTPRATSNAPVIISLSTRSTGFSLRG